MPRRTDPQPGIAKAIQALRMAKGWSQERLGKTADIHPTWISHLESGRINPTWGNMRRISDALGVPLGALADIAQQEEGDPLTARKRAGKWEIPKLPPRETPKPKPAPPPPPPPMIPKALLKKVDAVFFDLEGLREELHLQAELRD